MSGGMDNRMSGERGDDMQSRMRSGMEGGMNARLSSGSARSSMEMVGGRMSSGNGVDMVRGMSSGMNRSTVGVSGMGGMGGGSGLGGASDTGGAMSSRMGRLPEDSWSGNNRGYSTGRSGPGFTIGGKSQSVGINYGGLDLEGRNMQMQNSGGMNSGGMNNGGMNSGNMNSGNMDSGGMDRDFRNMREGAANLGMGHLAESSHESSRGFSQGVGRSAQGRSVQGTWSGAGAGAYTGRRY
eukprot:GFUD01002527.1.p1 GENE.GFUD01002527.1~~GFUD01002527.1.p1  ORF type:complete len:256 (+),score=63.37 GFUD01002527.1:53-769(+)